MGFKITSKTPATATKDGNTFPLRPSQFIDHLDKQLVPDKPFVLDGPLGHTINIMSKEEIKIYLESEESERSKLAKDTLINVITSEYRKIIELMTKAMNIQIEFLNRVPADKSTRQMTKDILDETKRALAHLNEMSCSPSTNERNFEKMQQTIVDVTNFCMNHVEPFKECSLEGFEHPMTRYFTGHTRVKRSYPASDKSPLQFSTASGEPVELLYNPPVVVEKDASVKSPGSSVAFPSQSATKAAVTSYSKTGYLFVTSIRKMVMNDMIIEYHHGIPVGLFEECVHHHSKASKLGDNFSQAEADTIISSHTRCLVEIEYHAFNALRFCSLIENKDPGINRGLRNMITMHSAQDKNAFAFYELLRATSNPDHFPVTESVVNRASKLDFRRIVNGMRGNPAIEKLGLGPELVDTFANLVGN